MTPRLRVGMDLAPKGFTSTYSVGEVVFHVIRLNEEEDRAAAMRTGEEVGLAPIWPITQDGVVWPPQRNGKGVYLDDDTLKRLATQRIWF